MNRFNHAMSTIGWGLFCACSWTWCIGMFLPTIMIRQFGWWGFIAFAIPNVIGCAAFGYVLTKKTSADLTKKYITAMRCFSYIVIVYHMFFIPFLLATVKLPLPNYFPPGFEASNSVALAGLVLVAAYAMSYLPKRLWLLAAIITYAISLSAFAQVGLTPLEQIPFFGELARDQLAWIAIVFMFGFLLCPYLDLTFHHARCESPSKHAFGVFGLTFAVMILLTTAYSRSLTNGLTPLIAAHIFVQMIFTIAVHLSQLRKTKSSKDRNFQPILLLSSIIVAVGSWAIQAVDHPLIIGEEFYMRFLLFFGLVFPSYILLFIGPGKTINRTRKTLFWYFIFIVVSTPLYEIGFFHGNAWLLAFPIAVVFTWKFAIHFTKRTTLNAMMH